MIKTLQKTFLTLLAFSQIHPSAQAGGLGGLLRATGDVISLGETRRDRKEKEREKQAAIARERAVAAQQKRAQEIASKKSEIEIYKKNYTELLMMRIDLEAVVQHSNQVITGLELAIQREVTMGDRIRLLFSISESNVQITNQFLDQIQVSSVLAKAEAVDEIASSLNALSALAKANKVSVAELIESVMQLRDKNEIQSLAESIVYLKGLITSLAANCDVRLRENMANHNALAQALLKLDDKLQVTTLEELSPRSWLAFFDERLVRHLDQSTLESFKKQCAYINCEI